jgi:hypothetical protein
MGKWFGKVGYAVTKETEPGIWEEVITEREYYGDITTDRWKRQNSGEVNDNINLSNVISIVADPFAYQNCSNMIYVEIMGAKWKISDIDVSQRPRLILTVGGVYNGEQA